MLNDFACLLRGRECAEAAARDGHAETTRAVILTTKSAARARGHDIWAR